MQITSAVSDATNRLLAFDYLKPFYRDPTGKPTADKSSSRARRAADREIFVINPDGTGMTVLTRPVTVGGRAAQQCQKPAESRRREHRLLSATDGGPRGRCVAALGSC
ncbi:MAG: hypothetical protein R2838_03525 [Caldilineaceae bacterium]